MESDLENNKKNKSKISQTKDSLESHWEGEIIDTLQNIETDYKQFKDNIKNLKDNLSGFIDETENKIKNIDQKTQKKVEKETVEKKMEDVREDIDEVDEKIFDVMEEMGFGESLDVSQIPPNILEEVYETTLEDVVTTMRNNLGDRETQDLVQHTLEKMRTRTSGSELFQYDGRTIIVRNLVKSIEQNLISAKQIHSTYTELINKLEENLPGYESKNFRSMMKSKSLEFAIGKTTELLRRTDKLEENLNSTSNILSTFTNQMNQQMNGLKTEISAVQENLDGKIDEKFSQFEERLNELEGSINELSEIKEDVDELNQFKEDKEELKEKIEEIEASTEMEINRLEDEVDSLKGGVKEESTEKVSDITDEESFVYYGIPDDGGTLNKIEKSVGEVVTDIEEKLDSLIEKNKIEKFKRGRWTIYQRKEEKEEGDEEGEEVEDEDILDEENEESEEIDEVSIDEDKEIEEGSDEEEEIEDQLEEELERSGEGSEEEPKGEEEQEVEDTEEREEGGSVEVEDGGGAETEGERESQEPKEGDLESLEGFDEEQKKVIENIPDDGSTLSKLNRNIEELDKDKIEEILEGLIDEDQVTTEKRNRWLIYLKATNPKEVK